MVIALVSYPIPFRTRKSSPPAPMVLCLKTWKSRSLPAIKTKIYEVPISYNGRSYQEGKKIKTTDALKALKTLIKYR